jgi:hypothetical protein
MDFPKQNIPEGEKTKQWHLDCVNAILKYRSNHISFTKEKQKDHENYLLYEGKFDGKQFEYVTETYGLTSPARLVNYPIIQPKIDLLVGELISQPLQFTVNVINRSAIKRKNEKKITIAAEMLLRPIRAEISKVLGVEFPEEELGEEIPDDIKMFQQYKFRDAVEDQVHIGLNFLIQKQDLKSIFKRGFYDLNITSKEFYKTYIYNGDPYVERIDPRQMIWDFDSDRETIQDSKFAGHENWYTVNEIIDKFGNDLSKEDLHKLEKIQNDGPNKSNIENYDSYVFDTITNTDLKVRVVEMQWKSLKQIKFKVSDNKFDPDLPFYKMVKDDYKPKKGEKIILKPITYIHQATKIGEEIIINWGPKVNQIRFEENYANAKLDYFGVIRNSFSGTTISVVDALKNIQLLYNITMFQIELTMQRAGGKTVIYDLSQKPTNVSLEQVMYHAKNSGVLFINSKQEGGQLSTYNQWGQIDFTLSNSVSQLINLKMMLEDTADKLTGISAARSGINKSGDLVGVTQQNIMQSSLITSPLFDIHYKIVGEVLNNLANLMRISWANEGRMANIFGDTGMEVFEIDKAISLDEYGVFVMNSGKEVQDKQAMLQMMQQYASTGSLDPLTALTAMRADSATEVEALIKKGIEDLRSQQIQMQERELAAQEQKNEIDSAKIQVPVQVAQITAESNIRVAEINAEAKLGLKNIEIEHDQEVKVHERKKEIDKTMLETANQETIQK